MDKKAYRVLICRKGTKRSTKNTKWVFEKIEAELQELELQEKEPEHDYLIEESAVGAYHVRWTDKRSRESREEVIFLPIKDPSGGLRQRIVDIIKHLEFKVYHSYLLNE